MQTNQIQAGERTPPTKIEDRPIIFFAAVEGSPMERQYTASTEMLAALTKLSEWFSESDIRMSLGAGRPYNIIVAAIKAATI